MRRLFTVFLSIALLLSGAGCITRNKGMIEGPAKPGLVEAMPHLMVYRQMSDCSNMLPVVLSEDKSQILSYPHPKDVQMADSVLLYPVVLDSGYFLDRIGITVHTAYLNINLAEYNKREYPFSMDEMLSMVQVKAPFSELWDCGVRGNISLEALNEMIRSNSLCSRCKKLIP